MRLLVVLLLVGSTGAAEVCSDLVDFCDSLRPLCIGSIIEFQLIQLQAVADQLANSTAIPALEVALPLIRSGNGLPLVGSSDGVTEPTAEQIEEQIKESLPLLKESLPLIRESLPLIRESLPLIRHILDPLYYGNDKTTCQKKVSCKSCRECPQLRAAVAALAESLCPATCKLCAKAAQPRTAAAALADLYV